MGAVFRRSLEQADHWRDALNRLGHGEPLIGALLLTATCATATAIAAWLVHRFSPEASGSGIPNVEAVLNQERPEAPFRLIPVKFFGGLLAIGSGLAMGREGPSVQMGGSLAGLIGTLCRRNWPDCRVLFAAGAGRPGHRLQRAERWRDLRAGRTGPASSRPGSRWRRIGASTAAISVARLFLGSAPDFQVEPLDYGSALTVPLYVLLGAVSGLAAVAYNRTLLGAIAAANRFGRWPVELRAGMLGAAIGVLAWFVPEWVGGGDPITPHALAGAVPLALVPFAFFLRFGLGAVSYAAKTPGGLFAPILVLGAQLGLLFGTAAGNCSPLWRFNRWLSQSSEWPPSSPAWFGRR